MPPGGPSLISMVTFAGAEPALDSATPHGWMTGLLTASCWSSWTAQNSQPSFDGSDAATAHAFLQAPFEHVSPALTSHVCTTPPGWPLASHV